jgi:BirA family biotin operon repressor/biotin-[acetyl-CoA-carboxylase] ligase
MKEIGSKIIRLESVDSTNNYTANLIKEGKIDHGTVILAVDQFGGRGQRDAEWLVKPGENLTLSIFLDRVNLSVENQFRISKWISLAVVDLLASRGIQAEIKWPNDIFVNGKKIAGMLIENSLGSSLVKSSIVGIGLNVNQTEFSGFEATSMKLELGDHSSLDELLFSLIGKINNKSSLLNEE